MGEKSQIETPKYDLSTFADVYEPREDTFLLIDTLEAELPFLRQHFPPDSVQFVLELGSGSGLVATALCTQLPSTCCFASDINMNACKATKHTGRMNNVHIECVCMNLASHFAPGKFDILIFNPPYVVTDPAEICGLGLSRTWAGGWNGRQIINQLLPHVPNILNANGVFYLLLLKENRPEEVISMFKQHQFHSEIIKERKILGEHLFTVRFIKS